MSDLLVNNGNNQDSKNGSNTTSELKEIKGKCKRLLKKLAIWRVDYEGDLCELVKTSILTLSPNRKDNPKYDLDVIEELLENLKDCASSLYDKCKKVNYGGKWSEIHESISKITVKPNKFLPYTESKKFGYWAEQFDSFYTLLKKISQQFDQHIEIKIDKDFVLNEDELTELEALLDTFLKFETWYEQEKEKYIESAEIKLDKPLNFKGKFEIIPKNLDRSNLLFFKNSILQTHIDYRDAQMAERVDGNGLNLRDPIEIQTIIQTLNNTYIEKKDIKLELKSGNKKDQKALQKQLYTAYDEIIHSLNYLSKINGSLMYILARNKDKNYLKFKSQITAVCIDIKKVNAFYDLTYKDGQDESKKIIGIRDTIIEAKKYISQCIKVLNKRAEETKL